MTLETRQLSLILSNDWGLQKAAMEAVEGQSDLYDAGKALEAAVYEWLEEEGGIDNLGGFRGMLLTEALGNFMAEVDWPDLADYYRSEDEDEEDSE